ncbi:lysylphosphatidylglycerol synthase domain-containing protein [Aurantiacibacter sp. MUD11]|uniref:lysylphosphatidylglycerol synthase domain-containing protein n=1 Tax=Aurantiacibacter sp. MUD11 TaxID=3003265 RepID=UPI0022AA0ADE|nr:lysylphosphatidylglycerol synthase domain-containing protein [Aurantiacibacter sp. MUD11]WAT18762.1 lysylphosphatidylglycerol synthase domain-containing protein [Aurantiacibacter sp. MUD11]
MKRAWRLIEQVLSVVGFAWLCWFIYDSRDTIFEGVATTSAFDLAALIGLILVSWFAMGLQNVVLLKSQNVNLGAGESLLVHASSSLLNYVPTRLGTMFRFRYLLQVHGLSYDRNLGLIALRFGLLLAISAVMATIGIVGLGLVDGVKDAALTLGLFAVAGIVVLLFLWRVAPSQGEGLLWRLWNGFVAAIHEGRQRKDRLAILAVLIVVQLALGAIRMDIAFDIVGTPVDLPLLLVVSPVVVVLGLFSFASLGVREAIIGGLVAATGHNFAAGVIAASAERAALLLLCLTLGVVGTAVMSLRMRAVARAEDESAS